MGVQRVVIIGAGFGGLECAKRLARAPVQVLLLDRNNYHLFTPLLYQVASSLLNPSDIAHPVRAVLRGASNVRFRMAEVTGVDLEAKTVRSADGSEFPYEYVVIATGSSTNYFGLSSVQATARGLKDLPEALELRNHVMRCFEAAARAGGRDRAADWLRFVVVGGGPTGVEYAGALSELVRRVLVKDYPDLDLGRVRITLVEAADRVLPAFPGPLGHDAGRRLRRMGVEVLLNTKVRGGSDRVVRLSGGESIEARTLVWAAGVQPSNLVSVLGAPTSESGRLLVDEQLRLKGLSSAFAIGDIAAVSQGGDEIPMLSAPAIQEGRYVARAITSAARSSSMKGFRYRDKGIMATIGRHAAVAQIGRVSLRGALGWLAWLFVHLYFIIGFRNRIAVMMGWAWNYLFYDRPIRLVARALDRTGAGATPEGSAPSTASPRDGA